MKFIPRIRLNITEQQVDILTTTFQAGQLVTGVHCELFKQELSSIFNLKNVTLTANGFSAIFLAIKALGVRKKKVLIPSIATCYAIKKAVLSSDNFPVYVDSSINSPNIDEEDALKIYKKKGFDIIISPNYFGIQSPIKALKKFNVPIIEDCAQSFLTSSNIKSLSDIKVFSFYPTKIMNAIDGGAILTDNNELTERANASSYYYTDNLNIEQYNFRMPNIHAAVGLESLKNLNNIKSKYKNIIDKYVGIVNRFPNINYLHSRNKDEILYKFILKFQSTIQCKMFCDYMNKNGIECAKELILMKNGKHLNAQNLIDMHCSIPLYESLSESEVDFVCYELNNALTKMKE